MTAPKTIAKDRAELLIQLLDIPISYYEMASERYTSLGEWFHRPDSALAHLGPQVYPQGSFRLGTVIRPLTSADEYDLDLVSEITALTKTSLSQADLKDLVGDEIKGYVKANGIKRPAEEKKRCWRVEYADSVKFHIDVLPAIPEDNQFRQILARRSVETAHIESAVAITDKTHPRYTEIQNDWPPSNPRGYAAWFMSKMRSAAAPRLNMLVEKRVYASIEDVPVYEWKTPLQRSIQLLKRHRDVMYRDQPDLKPISMILTTLAARVYQGESDLGESLVKIVDGMGEYVRPSAPRVPNPVNPAEDFADKWQDDHRLEESFWQWHAQAKSDVAALAGHLNATGLRNLASRAFGLTVDEARASALADKALAPPPAIQVLTGPKPWKSNG